jgi:hypothetical protein
VGDGEQFADLFAADVDEPAPPEPPPVHERPAWVGPPDGELGVAVPLGRVLARGDRGVVALSHALAYSTGLSFDLVAHVGGLDRRTAGSIFHEQHGGHVDAAELPDGFLRFGIELPDRTRVSNLGARRPWVQPGSEPHAPVLFQHGGGGGQSSGSSISWSLAFWLWPLPPAGVLRLACEWPVAGIGLTQAELDGAVLLEAAVGATRIWAGEGEGAWTRASSQYAVSQAREVAAPEPDRAVAVPAAELRAVQDALQAALQALRRLTR